MSKYEIVRRDTFGSPRWDVVDSSGVTILRSRGNTRRARSRESLAFSKATGIPIRKGTT